MTKLANVINKIHQ